MELLGYIASVLIGISLGMIGSGGSILTVPVLVYLLHINPLPAIASSLFIVGVTSLIGGIKAYAKKQIDFKAVTEFGIPSVFSIFVIRHYMIIPKEMFLMIIFAILMLAASVIMIRSRYIEAKPAITEKHNKVLPLFLSGLFVGVVTGLLGAGGGFLIIPSLVVFLKLSMKTAVGTSLFIIAVNSLFGFLFSLKQFEYDWRVLLVFTALATIGLFIGSRLSEKISNSSLKKGFGWFVLVMAIYIILKELLINKSYKS